MIGRNEMCRKEAEAHRDRMVGNGMSGTIKMHQEREYAEPHFIDDADKLRLHRAECSLGRSWSSCGAHGGIRRCV